MNSLTDLDTDALKVAQDAATVLVTDFRAYTPSSLFRMLVSKFRDDVREALEMEAEGILPTRANDLHPLSHLTSIELSTLAGSVMILLQDRFTKVMDDPSLPRLLEEFQDTLADETAERERIRGMVTP